MRGKKQKKTALKQVLIQKTGSACARCGKRILLKDVTIDHVVPKYRGGGDDERNLVPLCKRCNKQKGSQLVDSKAFYPYLGREYRKDIIDYMDEIGGCNGNEKSRHKENNNCKN